ncbi:MAG: transposase [Actinobacteria bacterium]|nr:transposase [Actinomycetota bacterium]
MAHRYRLDPEPAAESMLVRHCSDARFVWNLALEQANSRRPGRGPTPGAAARMRQLAEARRHSWLGEGSSSVQQQALRDFDQALKNWWAGTHRRPRWRKAGRDEGFCVRDVTVVKLNRKWATVFVPKCGPVRFRLSRPLPAEHGMARITLDRAGRWHVSFAAPQPPVVRVEGGAAVGIDRGVATTIATSDGQMLRIPSAPKLQAKLGRLHRRLARQQPGSGRRAKTKAEIGRTHARITDRRNDWIEKTTTALIRDHDVIVLEDLATKNMVRRPHPKPDPDAPGAFLPNGAAAKAGLNRVIQWSCWGRFERRLTDKATASGVTVMFVDPRHSSQTCPACDHVAPENRESQAVFRCVRCGHCAHADTNAATIILARGLRLAPAPGQGAFARVSPTAASAAGTTRRTAA